MIVCDNNNTSCSCDCFANIDIDAVVDNTTGRPNVTVNREGNKFTFAFSGLKGLAGLDGRDGQSIQGEDGIQGEPGLQGVRGITPDIHAEAHVNNTVGQPSVDVTRYGTPESPVFHFTFSGLKGLDGRDGADGRDGEDGRDGVDGKDGTVSTITNTLIDTITTRVLDQLDDTDEEIQRKVKNILSDSEFWQQLPEGIITGNSNFGEDGAIEEYLQNIGFWYTDPETGQTVTQWTKLSQTVTGINEEVVRLSSSQSLGGEVDYDALAGALYTNITGNTVTSGLQATWAHFLGLGDKLLVLEWLASGVESQAGGDADNQSAITTLFAAARQYKDNKEYYDQAWSGVNAIIKKDPNNPGRYIANSELVTMINDEVGDIINEAGFATQSSVDEAVATLFANGGSGRAYITAYVDAKFSNVTISADQILNLGQTILTTLSSNSVVIANGTVNASTIETGKVTNNGELFVISGDDMCIAPTSALKDVYIGWNGSGQLAIPVRTVFKNIYLNSTNTFNSGTFTSSGRITANSGITADNIRCAGNIEMNTNSKIYVSSGRLELEAPQIYIDATTFNGAISYTGSDENIKNIINNINLNVEDISNVRIVDYEFKSAPGEIHSGTIAQDWKEILPNNVREMDDEQHLAIDYSSTALISAVVDAREIVKLKQENAELKERLAAIEAKLAQL